MRKQGVVAVVFPAFLFFVLGFSSAFRASELDEEKRPTASLIEKGRRTRAAGDFARAAAFFKEVLRIPEEMQGLHDKAICMFNMGIISWDLGQIQESSHYFSDAASFFQTRGEAPGQSSCRKAMEVVRLYNLGKDYRSRNQIPESLDCFEKAINIGRETGIEDFELKCIRQKSLTYWQLSDMEMFFLCNKRGLEIAKKINHRKEVGRCLNNIGTYYEKVSDYSNALRSLEMALPFLRSEHDQESEAECLNNIGVVYKNLGEFNKALLSLSDALELDEKAGNPFSISTDRGNIGAVYLRRGWMNEDRRDLERALREFEICRDLLRANPNIRIELVALNNSGFAHYLLHEYGYALDLFSDALKRIDYQEFPEEYCHLLNNIANVHLGNGQPEKAMESFLRAINLSERSTYLEVLWEAYFGLGRCYEARKDSLKALKFYNKSIEAMEIIRRRITLDMFKISFARNKLVVYQRALDILYSLYLGSPSDTLLEEIYRMVERAKARAFLESLIEARIGVEHDTSAELADLEKKLSREISKLNMSIVMPGIGSATKEEQSRELAFKEEEYLRLISDMRTKKREYGEEILALDSSISKVQNTVLNERTALLEYSVGDNRSYLLFITLHHARLFELPGKPELEKSLQGYLKSLSFPSPSPFNGNRAAERIAQELIFPLQNEINSDIDTLIIIPDGILNYLPFEALMVNDEGSPIFLVQKYKISYCPSSTALFVLKQRTQGHKQMKSLLALGAPVYQERRPLGGNRERTPESILRELCFDEGFSLSSLPFSKKEVLKIAQHFPPHKRNIFLGKEANETMLKTLNLREYQVIHFACHGVLDDDLPFRSALILSASDGNEEDGFLQVREIYSLRMNAELVVLSACLTGNGTLERGEGLVGLTRSFFHAGAYAIMSSIWSVDDQSTVGFMDDFYSCLAQGQDKSSALRTAKLRMVKSSRSHPFYWAGFILNGDPAPVHFEESGARQLN